MLHLWMWLIDTGLFTEFQGTKTWEDSTLARIMKLTAEAQQNRPQLQRWLDDFGERYSQAVIIMSISVALLGPLLFKWPLIGNSGQHYAVFTIVFRSSYEYVIEI